MNRFPFPIQSGELPDGNRTETRLIAAVWLAASILTFWSFGFTVMLGSDLWWHLAAGKWLMTGWRWPFTDPWSFTCAGQPWNYHTWLAGVLYHGWASFLGLWSLVYWKWLMIVATYWLLMALLWRLTGSPAAGYLGAVLAAAAAAPLLDIRPNLYGGLGTVLLLWLTLPARKPSRWLPLLFLLWVNLHTSFTFGLMALTVVWGVNALVEKCRFPVWHWLACVGACLLNPKGVIAFSRPLQLALDPSSPFLKVAEWRPPFEGTGLAVPFYPYAIGAFLLAAAVLGCTGHWRVNRRLVIAGFALGVLTLAMSLKSLRFIPLFGLAASVTVSAALAVVITLVRRWMSPGGSSEPDSAKGPASLPCRPSVAIVRERLWAWVPPLVALLAGIVLMVSKPVVPGVFVSLTGTDKFPVEACNFIDANAVSGNVFAFYGWGGYLEFRAGGRLKVFIDGRIDQVFDEGTFRRYLRVAKMEGDWIEVLEASGAQYVLWPNYTDMLPLSLLRTRRWEILYHDLTAILLARAGQPLPAAFKPTPDGPYREMKLGFDAWAGRRLAEAERHFQRAAQLLPWMGSAWDALAAVQAEQGNPAAAHRTMERRQRVFPFPVTAP